MTVYINPEHEDSWEDLQKYVKIPFCNTHN